MLHLACRHSSNGRQIYMGAFSVLLLFLSGFSVESLKEIQIGYVSIEIKRFIENIKSFLVK